MTFLFFTAGNKQYEYESTSLPEALTDYIRTQVGFEKYFGLSQTTWLKLQNCIETDQNKLLADPTIRIELFNGFVKRNKLKIIRIVQNQREIFSNLA